LSAASDRFVKSRTGNETHSNLAIQVYSHCPPK